jgi:hypothetical protein
MQQKGHRYGGRRRRDRLKPQPILKTAGQQRRRTHSDCGLFEKFVNELRRAERDDLYSFRLCDSIAEQFYDLGERR